MNTNPTACRVCDHPLEQTLVDLGEQPLANSYLRSEADIATERRFPLHVRVCGSCLLAQVEAVVSAEEIFSEYAYFSSYSDSWLAHARAFAVMAVDRFRMSPDDLVVEVASNDGYLLRFFRELGIGVLGVEPAANVAAVAQEAGIDTEIRFFGREVASEIVGRGLRPRLIVANNVLAHVPDLNDFIAGLRAMASEETVISVEVPHLLHLMSEVQFDTIYHEHFSYFSLLSAEAAFARHGLRVFDVQRLSTHGGSLRLLVCASEAARAETAAVEAVREQERDAGLHLLETYGRFRPEVERCRASLLAFLADCKAAGRRVVAYGAAAKGNTLLNYCGISSEDVEYVVDRNPHKQGRLLPGSHLKIYDPARLFDDDPDHVLVLPWNLACEIVEQLADIRARGGTFLVAVPTVHQL